jgi:hypothetical protein
LEDLLEWVPHAETFSDENEIYGGKTFEPRYPKSIGDLLALTALRVDKGKLSGKLSGNKRREIHTLQSKSLPLASVHTSA